MQPHLERRYKADILNIDDVQAGDYFFLCCDGVLEQLTNDMLGAILSDENLDDQGKIDAIKEVCDGRTRDNYTCWLIPIDKVAAEATDVATSVEDYTIATVMPDDDCTVRPSGIRDHCMAQASVVQNLPKHDEGSCVGRFFKKLFRKDK